MQSFQNQTIRGAKKPNVESTPMVPNGRNFHKNAELDLFSPICLEQSKSRHFDATKTFDTTRDLSAAPYSIRDISTWIGGAPVNLEYSESKKSTQEVKISEKIAPVREMHTDLDEALAKLQQILANNFVLDGKLQFSHYFIYKSLFKIFVFTCIYS